jgi:hypothetical protein
MRAKNILFVLILGVIFSPASSLTLEIEGESPKGPEVIGVVVEEINPEAVQDGLSREQIRKDIEENLHKAGIRVDEKFKKGFLRFEVNAPKDQMGKYALFIKAEFVELDYMARYRSRDPRGAAWARGYKATVEASYLSRYVRDKVAALVDMFVNEYLTLKAGKQKKGKD